MATFFVPLLPGVTDTSVTMPSLADSKRFSAVADGNDEATGVDVGVGARVGAAVGLGVAVGVGVSVGVMAACEGVVSPQPMRANDTVNRMRYNSRRFMMVPFSV